MGVDSRAVCTRSSLTCDDCGRDKCSRCGRCEERYPGKAPGTWTTECPSIRCRIVKKLRWWL